MISSDPSTSWWIAADTVVGRHPYAQPLLIRSRTIRSHPGETYPWCPDLKPDRRIYAAALKPSFKSQFITPRDQEPRPKQPVSKRDRSHSSPCPQLAQERSKRPMAFSSDNGFPNYPPSSALHQNRDIPVLPPIPEKSSSAPIPLAKHPLCPPPALPLPLLPPADLLASRRSRANSDSRPGLTRTYTRTDKENCSWF